MAGRAAAQSEGEGDAPGPRLGEVVVEAPRPSEAAAASSDEIPARDLELRPHSTTHELLNDLPGVVVAQHQGGGKAPQYLVRGFDADHGTDFAVFVDDLPVNLPTHAHGQGYADLNFVIPETIERFDLSKGPYFVRFGDFANAGALEIVTRDELPENFVGAEGGSFDTQHYVAGLSPRLGAVKTLVAGQAYYSNGPFDHPEHDDRYALFTKFSLALSPSSKLSLALGLYQASWRGSGQIPLREGSIGSARSIRPKAAAPTGRT